MQRRSVIGSCIGGLSRLGRAGLAGLLIAVFGATLVSR
jgi:hypothetical protein